ncbi:helix-turn-helix domain-containing protein [Paraburkholderia sp.]|uniref:helix-turn-helix domain-containing protein n=1 Tax=Paraburkholderia sp. TaxID=1926495 RepID=UPI0025F910E5|nr:helix-turn-helix domain-containing protein [Paraburkholderia sp.]
MSSATAVLRRLRPAESCRHGQAPQQELFEAQTQWFHVFKAMIDSGDVAKMGPHAATTYLVIKAHTNYTTGRAFPALETIAAKAGISLAQVKRELKTLGEHGYITKSKVGRHNEYRLREKVEIVGEDGRPAAVATWDYLPSTVKHAVADLHNVLVTGDLAGAKVVHIERLQLNVNHLHDNATNFNIQQFIADLENLPPDIRDKIKSAYQASAKRGGDDSP